MHYRDDYSLYVYMHCNPVIHIDPQGTIAIWIGGAGDKGKDFGFGPTYTMRTVMNAYKNTFGEQINVYMGHYEKDKIVDIAENAIMGIEIDGQLPNCQEMIHLIGHSWGGVTALEVAKELDRRGWGHRIGIIVTLDPVSNLPGANPTAFQTWINVYQEMGLEDLPGKLIPVLGDLVGGILQIPGTIIGANSPDDLIATTGGQLHDEAGATKNIPMKVKHADADIMMKEALIQLGKLSR
jgi:pimeloyl-ACP methyl ester carboxylesterase